MGHSPVLTDAHERYPAEPKTRAARMYHGAQSHYTGDWPAMSAVAEPAGVSTPDTHPVDTSMNTLEHSLRRRANRPGEIQVVITPFALLIPTHLPTAEDMSGNGPG